MGCFMHILFYNEYSHVYCASIIKPLIIGQLRMSSSMFITRWAYSN